MTELEKIAYAKSFIDKLARGINPLDDTAISEDDIVNHPRLCRCFFYVSEVLGQVLMNGKKSEAGAKKPSRGYFSITTEQLSRFQYSDAPITTSEFCKRLECLVDLKRMRGISRQSLPEWLVSLELLTPPSNGTRYSACLPTEEGKRMGIAKTTYQNEYGVHSAFVLGIEAQKFIIDNMEAFLAFRKRSKLKI